MNKMCAFNQDRRCNKDCAAWSITVLRESTTRYDPCTKSYEGVADRKPYLATYCERGKFFIGVDADETWIDVEKKEG